MLERYYLRPNTLDRLRASWLGDAIERYVTWLADGGYAARNVFRRVPILRRFGEVARARGATAWDQLPAHVDAFVETWVREHGEGCRTELARKKVADEARNAVEQMLRLVLPGFRGRARAGATQPFSTQAGDFFEYLRQERGLRDESLRQYWHHLGRFEAYLRQLELHDFHGDWNYTLHPARRRR